MQSDQSLCWSLEYSLSVKLLTEHHLECLSLKGGCTGSSESTLVKKPHYWESHVMAQIITPPQFGLTHGVSSVNQRVYIYNSICQALNEDTEVRAVLWDKKNYTTMYKLLSFRVVRKFPVK